MPLLLELTRALRARRFYLPEDPAQASVLQRAARVWTAALARSAVLSLHAEENGFELGVGVQLSGPGLGDLSRALRDAGVSSLVVLPGLREEEFLLFVGLLARAADAAAPEPGLMRALATAELPHICSGDAGPISLVREELAREGARETGRPEPDGPQDSGSDSDSDLSSGQQVQADAEPPEAEAPIESALPSSHEITGELAFDANPIDDLIAELERSPSLANYERVCRSIASELEQRMHDKDYVDAYRTALVLGRHSAGLGPKLVQVPRCASDTLRNLVFGSEELLRISVQRAYAPATGSAVEAVQLLVALGAEIVPRLLEEHTRGSEDAQALTPGILVVMGDSALPVLISELGAESPARVRRAARLLGEMQHPRAESPLISLLGSSNDDGILREAARSLARIGTRRSITTLCDALTSRRGRVAWAAAYGLGWTGEQRGRAALCEVVRDPGRSGDQVRLQAVSSLARLGGADAIEALADSLEESGGWNRKRVRGFRLAVVEALGRMQGERARSVLERGMREGDRFLRDACEKALRGLQ